MRTPSNRETKMRTITHGLLVLALATGTGACDLDISNPNAPAEEEVVNDLDGLVSVAVGMQDQWASAVDDWIVPSALITDSWGTADPALASYLTLMTGEEFQASFGVVEAPFAATYRVVRSANILIGNFGGVDAGEGLTAGVLALARLYKAMALGQAIQIYEEIPLDVDVENPVPVGRDQVLAEVISLLEAARQDLSGVSDDDLAGFRTRVLGDDLDIRNTVDAMLARFYLLDGQYQAAIDAAGRVDRTVFSTFTYASPDRNPIFALSGILEYVKPLASFVAEAEDGDGRIDYWISNPDEPFSGKPPDTLLVEMGQYDSDFDGFPVYLPDEMRLIQAEAHTRLGQLGQAADLVNAVRTQGAPSVAGDPAPNLPALPPEALDTEAELLAQIAYERRYELYLQGLRWEDTRRLGESVTTTPTMTFMPLPTQECQTNTSVPCPGGG